MIHRLLAIIALALIAAGIIVLLNIHEIVPVMRIMVGQC